jgi:hypothetical protein
MLNCLVGKFKYFIFSIYRVTFYFKDTVILWEKDNGYLKIVQKYCNIVYPSL